MKLKDVIDYYGNSYRFNKETNMSSTTFRNWKLSGRVPFASQCRLERLTKGKLVAEWEDEDEQ